MKRQFQMEVKAEPDADGYFEGYASVFENVDRGMDVISRGAFTQTLANGFGHIKLLWQHDMREPIGVPVEVAEDERGLFFRGRILKDVRRGAEAIALLRAKALDGMSIGYKVRDAVPEADGAVRRITQIDLFEVSLVTLAMNPLAQVTSLKSARGLEHVLREAGYSNQQARRIVNGGFKGLSTECDAAARRVAEERQEAASLMENLQKLGGAF